MSECIHEWIAVVTMGDPIGWHMCSLCGTRQTPNFSEQEKEQISQARNEILSRYRKHI